MSAKGAWAAELYRRYAAEFAISRRNMIGLKC